MSDEKDTSGGDQRSEAEIIAEKNAGQQQQQGDTKQQSGGDGRTDEQIIADKLAGQGGSKSE